MRGAFKSAASLREPAACWTYSDRSEPSHYPSQLPPRTVPGCAAKLDFWPLFSFQIFVWILTVKKSPKCLPNASQIEPKCRPKSVPKTTQEKNARKRPLGSLSVALEPRKPMFSLRNSIVFRKYTLSLRGPFKYRKVTKKTSKTPPKSH